MIYRILGKTDWEISEISLGTWQVGGRWGSGFDQKNAEGIINRAIDLGINFIDTADVYENGLSEAAVAKVVKTRNERVYIATKCGRKISPHTCEGYTTKILGKFVDDSLKNTKLDALDLIQLHCPPTEVYYRPEIFDYFDRLQGQGKIRHLGVSVEKVEEALKAIEYPNVVSVQIIFNMFRHRPSELFFKEAKKKNIGIIVRVPLASGLLSGKYSAETRFEQGDHRCFNREGAAFDKGETFSGVPYEIGLKAVAELKNFLSEPLAVQALKWIMMFPEVSTIIPGASKVDQLTSNIGARKLPVFDSATMSKVNDVYNQLIRPYVHQRW